VVRGSSGVLSGGYARLIVGVVLATSVVAFEGLALATVAPSIASELGGVGLYGRIFSGFLLAQVVGAVGAGQRTDRAGLAGPFFTSLALLGPAVAEHFTWRAVFYGFLPFLALVGFLVVPSFGRVTLAGTERYNP
jgi:hypothetical protein